MQPKTKRIVAKQPFGPLLLHNAHEAPIQKEQASNKNVIKYPIT